MSDTENKKGTQYGVFQVDNGGDVLRWIRTVTAKKDTAAIEGGLMTTPVDGEEYMAIPTRFLRIRTVKIDPNPKVVIT